MYYRSKTAGQTDFNGDSYYYETNQQGDVTGLYKITYDAANKALSATRVASYEYDAWGNVTYSTGTIAKINPLKYLCGFKKCNLLQQAVPPHSHRTMP